MSFCSRSVQLPLLQISRLKFTATTATSFPAPAATNNQQNLQRPPHRYLVFKQKLCDQNLSLFIIRAIIHSNMVERIELPWLITFYPHRLFCAPTHIGLHWVHKKIIYVLYNSIIFYSIHLLFVLQNGRP